MGFDCSAVDVAQLVVSSYQHDEVSLSPPHNESTSSKNYTKQGRLSTGTLPLLSNLYRYDHFIASMSGYVRHKLAWEAPDS